MEFPGERLVIKMWDSLVDKGIGAALQPWQEKRLGKTRIELRKDELTMLADIKKQALNTQKIVIDANNVSQKLPNLDKNHSPLAQRVEPTIDLDQLSTSFECTNNYDAIRQEINLSKAITIAENILENDEQEVPKDSLDEDWLYTWRDYAGRTSSSELQDLWGQVLAGEVKGPGTYSFRTLEFLKGLSKSEAEIISKVAQFVLNHRIWRKKKEFFEKENITFSNFLFLQDLGILSGVESGTLSDSWESATEKGYENTLVSYNLAINIKHDNINNEAKAHVYVLTSLGQQVLTLASFGSNREYLESIAKDYAKQGYEVVLAKWQQITEDSGKLTDKVIIQADD